MSPASVSLRVPSACTEQAAEVGVWSFSFFLFVFPKSNF